MGTNRLTFKAVVHQMSPRRRAGLTSACLVVLFAVLAVPPARAADPEVDFFENSVRPILAERCFGCHGPKKQWASLRLDSSEAMLQGGDTGPAVVPGKPEESELVKRIRDRDEDVRMPPADSGKPLTEMQIAALVRWIEHGAHWPATALPVDADKQQAQASHWAFQPVQRPELPTVKDTNWAKTPIDHFIAQRLESAGLPHSAEADRRTLIRRATYDLTGLPPTPAEVAAFLADESPQAYEQLIERLLQSPRYGEKWGRHWLDVARYSDTKGYVYAREERFFVNSAAYRNWVIDAFNKDVPFNRFVMLQLAADQITDKQSEDLAAMGYLTLGRRFLGVIPDIVDDRIDVVSRGLLGLTVGCARCHDHKYDPIPTADYYSLYGILDNCTERLVELPRDPQIAAPAADVVTQLQQAKQKLAETTAARRQETGDRVRNFIGRYLMAQHELDKYPDLTFNQVISKDDLLCPTVWEWNAYLTRADQRQDPVFIPWTAFYKLNADEFATKAAEITQQLKQQADKINPIVAATFEQPPASRQEVADRYAKLFQEVDAEWHKLCDDAKANNQSPPQQLPDAAREALRQVLYAADSPCVLPDEPIVSNEFYYDTGTIIELWKLQNEVDKIILQAPLTLPHAVIMEDCQQIAEHRVFRRGNPANKTDVAPRQMLQIIAGKDRQPFQHGSGRLELAQQITSPDNPLTARVWVNRVWLQHFGTGLVNTPSDFGLRAETPSHPELLDWLASEFVAQGWSTKALHRAIMLSATYRQASTTPDDKQLVQRAVEVDPKNRLLWRMNARRMSFEQFRDTIIFAAGQLDESKGVKPDDLFPGGSQFRRAVYCQIDRQYLPTVMRVFDFANPDLHSPQRAETTIPQQALFAWNSPFVAERAKALVQLAGIAGTSDPAAVVRQLYQQLLQRDPTPEQLELALGFIGAPGHEVKPTPSATSIAWSYGYGEIDPSTQQLKSFERLPYLGQGAWQGGEQWPDARLGWAQLTAQGGHPGNDLQHAVVRRWTAPSAGKVTVQSEIIHQPEVGDGIRCWVISSRHGVLKTTPIHHNTLRIDLPDIAVEPGDTIDFVVDILANLNSDQYLWAPVVIEQRTTSTGKADSLTYDAEKDFPASPVSKLTPMEQFAQLLLLSNELMFVD